MAQVSTTGLAANRAAGSASCKNQAVSSQVLRWASAGDMQSLDPHA
jgi:hypothetical protein